MIDIQEVIALLDELDALRYMECTGLDSYSGKSINIDDIIDRAYYFLDDIYRNN